jgi:predicted amidohydrolase
MRLAIAQTRMHWTLADNLASMRRSLGQAADAGAALCVFGELALTGYHRQIAREADPASVADGISALQAACAQAGVAAAVGAPTWPAAGGKPMNSHLLIDEHGLLQATVAKDGLTLVETFFFQPGQGREVATLQVRRCTAVLCREVEDGDAIAALLPPGRAELVFWPSLTSPRDDDGAAPYPPLVQELARRSGAWWVQCNWPNALNTPMARGLGGSIVVAPDGEIRLQLPLDEAGLAIFDLGARCFDWHPEACNA